MKLPVTREKNNQPTGIPQVRIMNDELGGFKFVIASGDEFIIVKASDLLDLVNNQEKPETDLVNE